MYLNVVLTAVLIPMHTYLLPYLLCLQHIFFEHLFNFYKELLQEYTLKLPHIYTKITPWYVPITMHT